MDRRTFVVTGACLLSACAAPSAESGVFEALKSGGHVIYFRHAATDRRGTDAPDWSRSRQRNLSEFGKLQSRQIGEGALRRGIPIGDVRVSPFFRCMDMAELAFGRFETDDRLISTSNAEGDPAGRVAYLKRLISTPFDGPNLVLIAHSSNIRDAAGLELAEGEAAVLRPTGGGFASVGTLGAELW